MTVREFVELTKNAFGGQVIRQLKKAYNLYEFDEEPQAHLV